MHKSCKECGCTCKTCGKFDNDIHLHVEIESLRQKLIERDNYIVKLETNFLKSSTIDNEVVKIREEMVSWQDKYKRLSDAHKRVQRVNQGLEDKLLKLVDICETDKNALTKDVVTLSEKLAEANYKVKKLTENNERYKNDVNLAIQFLQCKQSNFVAHKFESLPATLQTEVSAYITFKKKPEEKKPIEPKSIKVPIPTFPPTAMFYSVPKTSTFETKNEDTDSSSPTVDVVSAAIMAKVLEERQRERMCIKHCDTCTCSKNLKLMDPNRYHDVDTQTDEVCFETRNEFQQANFQMPKLPRTTDIANAKVPNFELESFNNIVKVQPNNFLVEKSSSNTSSIIDIDVNSNLDPGDDHNEESIDASLNIPNVHFTIENEERNNANNEVLDSDREKTRNARKNFNFPNLNIVGNQIGYGVRCSNDDWINSPINKNDIKLCDTGPQVSEKISIEYNKKESPYLVNFVNDNCATANKFLNIENFSLKNDNSKNIRIHCDIDKSKYREMEENVKSFLFKKKELWREQSAIYTMGEHSSDKKHTYSHTQTEI